ncbi:hypothetical protein BDV96DRAFT_324121 [Lophiotrema nucula]|uniref:Rhodopsin domain-containing protein n=1 Tax=Lophiotrema nucula TaxID=690887 RepID=A0A6A5ZN24_9PLEO|nr:hypothetical protein BDV96DRAFT_324121 [Lophiotrema nucula]
MFIAASSAGQGSHIWNVSNSTLKQLLLFSNITDILFAPAMLFAKSAILVSIGRTLRARTSITRWAVHIVVACTALIYAGIFFAQVFACMPRAKISDQSAAGKCISRNGTIIGFASIDTALTFAILLFAFLTDKSLDRSRKRSVGVAVLASAGVFACAASVVRLVYNVKLASSNDFAKVAYIANMWTVAELTTIIVGACLPTIPPLLAYLHGRSKQRVSYPAESAWATSDSSRINLPGISSRSRDLYHTDTTTSTATEPSLSHEAPSASTESIAPSSGPAPSVQPFEPFERPISHLSYDSYMTASMAQVLDSNEPLSPISPSTISMSAPTSPQIQQATQMSVTPIRFASIKKTVDVRVSNHTNPGSPVRFGTQELGW